MAVHDADAEAMDLRAEVLRFRMALPVILDALRIAVGAQEYEARRKRYRDLLEALGGREEAT